MEASDWIGPAATILLTALAVVWLEGKNNAAPPVQDGLMRFRMPKAIGILGWICVALALVMVPGCVTNTHSPVLMLLFSALFALFAWLGSILVRDARNHQAACNEDIIVVIDRYNRLDSCRWPEIISGRVHPLSRMIVLRTRDGRTLSVSAYLKGSDSLFTTMARRTRLPVQQLVAKARAMG